MRARAATLPLAALLALSFGPLLSPHAEAQTGAITGTVTAATGGAPLSGIPIRAYTSSGATAGSTAYTDGTGVYLIGGLTTGTYYVRTFYPSSYLDQLYSGIDCLPSCTGVTTGTPVSVTTGEFTSNINFALLQYGKITGTVRGADTSVPISGAIVYAYTSAGNSAGSGTTNASGVFTINALLPRAHFVRTSNTSGYLDQLHSGIPCIGGSCTVTTGTAVTVPSGGSATVDFSLPRGATISGTVTTAGTGTPVSGVTLQVYYANGTQANPTATTDAAGRYTLSGLKSETYYVRTYYATGHLDQIYNGIDCQATCPAVTSGAAISVASGEDRVGVDFALIPKGSITGTVISSGTGLPLPGVVVAAYNSAGAYVYSAGTNASGVYTLPSLLPGSSYFVRTSNSNGYVDQLHAGITCEGGRCAITAGTAVPVSSGAATTVDFALAIGGTISGTITAAANGAPLSWPSVYAYNAAGDQVGSGGVPNSSGQYTITGLASGTHFVRTVGAYPWVDQIYNGIDCRGACPAATAGTGVEVTIGQPTSGVNFSLLLTGSITGTVRDADTGQPIANIIVVAYASDGTAISGQALTNGSGVYALSGVPPGNIYLKTLSMQYVGELYPNIVCPAALCDVASGTPVVLSNGGSATADFELSLGGSITGTITDEVTGRAVANVTVHITGGADLTILSVTNSSGNYYSSGVPAGQYFLRTSNSQSYVDELYQGITCPNGNCNVSGGTGVTVAKGEARSGVDFSLAWGGAIVGTVTVAGTSTPLAGAVVTAYGAGGAKVGEWTSNAAGIYGIGELPPGSYYVRASAVPPYLAQVYGATAPCPPACDPAGGTPVAVSGWVHTMGIDIALRVAVPGEFSGDLHSDVLWRHATQGDVWLWPMDGATRTAETYVRTVADTDWEIRSAADFTGDGKADILWRHKTSGQIYFWPMNGSAPQAETFVATVDPAYDIAGTGDFDGDGKADILWRHQTLGEVWVWRMDGATPLDQVYLGTVDPAYVVKGVADLDGDGKADIVWHHATAGEVWAWRMDGTTRLSETWVGTVADVGYQIAGFADFTGDRKADLLWRHATLGEVWLWRMDGTTKLAETWVGTVPDANYRIVNTGDYDGDGKADILWHHATLGEVWVWLMDGATKLSETWVATVPDVGYRVVR
jgi:hypothetical protein